MQLVVTEGLQGLVLIRQVGHRALDGLKDELVQTPREPAQTDHRALQHRVTSTALHPSAARPQAPERRVTHRHVQLN